MLLSHSNIKKLRILTSDDHCFCGQTFPPQLSYATLLPSYNSLDISLLAQCGSVPQTRTTHAYDSFPHCPFIFSQYSLHPRAPFPILCLKNSFSQRQIHCLPCTGMHCYFTELLHLLGQRGGREEETEIEIGRQRDRENEIFEAWRPIPQFPKNYCFLILSRAH